MLIKNFSNCYGFQVEEKRSLTEKITMLRTLVAEKRKKIELSKLKIEEILFSALV